MHWVICWTTANKPFIDTLLTFFVLMATVGLCIVGALQASAAWKQIKASNAQLKEVLSQGIASRRPFLTVVPETDPALLFSIGPGIAFDITWSFGEQAGFGGLVTADPLGAMAAGASMPLGMVVAGAGRKSVTLQEIGSYDGIRFEYQDSTGKRYFSRIARGIYGHTFVSQTGEIV